MFKDTVMDILWSYDIDKRVAHLKPLIFSVTYVMENPKAGFKS